MGSTTFGKPTDTEIAELNSKIPQYAKITGTTPSSAGQRTTVSYPTGYSRDNCIVVGGYVMNGGNGYSLGFPGIYANLYSSGIGFGLTSADGDAFVNKPFTVLLMKLPS